MSSLVNIIHIPLETFKVTAEQAATSAINKMITHFCDGDSFLGDPDTDFKDLHDKIVEKWNSDVVRAIGFIWGYDHVYVFGVHDEYTSCAYFDTVLLD